MSRPQPAPGGGTRLDVSPDRLVGWVTRFGAGGSGLESIIASPNSVMITAGDGTTAELAVPFAPMAIEEREPIEALLDHLDGIGALGVILVRAGAYSVGVARDRVVLSSSTDRQYVQGRTAAGGQSQQRFARRRSNQRRQSYDAAADAAARALLPVLEQLDGLVLGGDRPALATVLADRRLAPLASLRSRTFADVPEPRRAVLDAVAARSLDVTITIRR